ncbi:MAG: cell division protein FtsL [Treponema sp.]
MKNVIAVLLTLGIPLFLFLGVWQSARYTKVEKAVQDYDREQYRLIEENKRKISAISILLRNERIEKIATQTFKMRKADSSEILRVEVEKKSSKGVD